MSYFIHQLFFVKSFNVLGPESEADEEVSEPCLLGTDQQGATPMVVSIEVTLLVTF